MKSEMSSMLKNERGAALWTVMVISFIVLFIMTSSFAYLFEHRKILHMRLQQVQARELVKNGIVHLQDQIANNEPIQKGTETEHFTNGSVVMQITNVDILQIQAIVSGYVSKGAVQSYNVHIDPITGKVTYYVKTVLGSE